jgi:PAS domain S-box-containing protein
VVVKDRDLIGGVWPEVLDHLGDAVIVLDGERNLRHVNHAARRLLGYEKGSEIGGRCRLTTRGIDCDNACPLTFALDHDLDQIEDFPTVYKTHDGRAVPLRITVIPMTDEDGRFRGAIEILRPAEPDPGFFLAGSSPSAQALRERVSALARSRIDVCLVGEPSVCRDVALAMHRFSSVPENLFQVWAGSWDGISPWPPGTVYACDGRSESLLGSDRPEGWRVVIASTTMPDSSSLETLELPSAEDRQEDLPQIIVSWVGKIAPSTRITREALERLVRMARDRGFEELEGVLTAALAAAGECLDVKHLPVDGYRTALVDELLRAPKPLAALEERLLREVLERCEWRMQEAADRLAISRVTLWRKMKDIGIEKGP